MDYIFLVVGFVLLIKGADWFVDGSASVAKKFHIPTLIIGMTIVAMGTSAPELAVSLSASLKGNNEIAFSNVVGSNIFNLLAVCGCCALLKPLTVKASTLKIEFPLSILAAGVLAVMGYGKMELERIDGFLLAMGFVLFMVWMVMSARKNKTVAEQEEYKDMPIWKCLIFIIVGIVGIVLGGNFVVDSASAIALSFGLSQTLVGLTIVSVGTSLPELVTSVVAAKKGDVDMALGNVIGSNLFNILLILGLSSLLSPMAVQMESIYDTLILVVVSVFVLACIWKKKMMSRVQGGILVGIYMAYICYICIR